MYERAEIDTKTMLGRMNVAVAGMFFICWANILTIFYEIGFKSAPHAMAALAACAVLCLAWRVKPRPAFILAGFAVLAGFGASALEAWLSGRTGIPAPMKHVAGMVAGLALMFVADHDEIILGKKPAKASVPE